jgi:hypothetical protein
MMAARPKRMTGTLASQVQKDPEEALLECYRFISRIGKRLPPQPNTREKFARRLIGATMKCFDLKPEKFVPVELPINPRRMRELNARSG